MFVDIDKLLLKFMWKGNETRTPKTILKKENNVRGIILPDFRAYSRTAAGMECGALPSSSVVECGPDAPRLWVPSLVGAHARVNQWLHVWVDRGMGNTDQ